MKSHLSALLLLALVGGPLPLCAQNMTVPTTAPAPDTTNVPGVQTVAAPPRNIMPLSTNHSPHPIQPPPEIAASINQFFKNLHGGDYPTAYQTFLAGTRLGQQPEKMSVFISKTQEAFGIYGALSDAEIYDNYSIGSNVLVLTYLSRHSIQPLRWRFIYYRPDKQWGLINMGFDDVLLDMLD